MTELHFATKGKVRKKLGKIVKVHSVCWSDIRPSSTMSSHVKSDLKNDLAHLGRLPFRQVALQASE
eukprot:6126506-Amphidinium_carterae.2